MESFGMDWSEKVKEYYFILKEFSSMVIYRME